MSNGPLYDEVVRASWVLWLFYSLSLIIAFLSVLDFCFLNEDVFLFPIQRIIFDLLWFCVLFIDLRRSRFLPSFIETILCLEFITNIKLQPNVCFDARSVTQMYRQERGGPLHFLDDSLDLGWSLEHAAEVQVLQACASSDELSEFKKRVGL